MELTLKSLVSEQFVFVEKSHQERNDLYQRSNQTNKNYYYYYYCYYFFKVDFYVIFYNDKKPINVNHWLQEGKKYKNKIANL